MLPLSPDLNDCMLDLVYGEEGTGLFKAVIIEAFGIGNLPNNSRLKDLIAQKTKEGSD